MARKKRSKLSARIKRSLAAGFAAKLQEDPDQYAKLVEAGVIDPVVLQRMSEAGDFGGMIRQFKTGITEVAREKPSVLVDLDVRPLDVLSEGPYRPQSPSPSDTIERTIVFSDLEGFTAFTREQGDLAASSLLNDHYDAVDAITAGRGGFVVKRLGDGHMLAFEQPAAAVFASLELVADGAEGLALRAGGHHGQVVQMSGDLFGDVVNVAARVTDLAPGGEALVTSELRDVAVPLDRVAFGRGEMRELDGIDTPVEVCPVRSV